MPTGYGIIPAGIMPIPDVSGTGFVKASSLPGYCGLHVESALLAVLLEDKAVWYPLFEA
jgi:hypothetical protein